MGVEAERRGSGFLMAGSSPHGSSLHSGSAHVPVRPNENQGVETSGSSSVGKRRVGKAEAIEEGLSRNGETEVEGEESMERVRYRDDMTDEEHTRWWKANRKKAEERMLAEEKAREEETGEGGDCSDDGDEDGSETEARVAAGRKSPKMPTKLEVEEHNRTHLLDRVWCKHCVMSRARNSPHRRKVGVDELEEIKVPRIHILVMADERTGSRMARLTGRKGLGEYGEMDWLLEELSKTLKGWGHTGGPGS